MPNDPKDRQKDSHTSPDPRRGQQGEPRKNPQQQGGPSTGRPAGKGEARPSQNAPRSPRAGSDDDQSAGERTAPGKPKEFDETVRRKRGEEQARRDAGAAGDEEE